jgi:PPM family protein phosphatase
MTLALRYAARSDQGLVRTNNEDSVYAGPRLLAVADGMGGHAAGEVASNVVISSLAYLDEDRRADDLINELREATANANSHLRRLTAEDPNLEGMGTTLTGLLFAGSRIGVVHVGDSRAYLLRGGELAQITHDDTFVQALIDEGRLTKEEAHSHPQRSLILRALNGTDVEPDLSIREARIGDRYLLCSDGLSDVVSTETIFETLQLPDPQQSADRLVELALRGGGPDNVTCVVADVIDVEYGDDAPVVDGAASGNRGQRDPEPTTPAARAALAGPRPGRPEPEDVPVDRPRRPLRAVLAALAVLAVLGGGLWGLWRWTQTQYFVGEAADNVVVYRGINTALGPLRLYDVIWVSDLRTADLQQAARRQVESGIGADNRSDADGIVARLHDQTLPPCPTPIPTQSHSPAMPTRQPNARPEPTRTTTTLPANTTQPAPTPTPTPTATAPPDPAEDCR